MKSIISDTCAVVEQMDIEDATTMEFVIKRSLLSKNKLAMIVKGKNGETEYCCVECSVRYDDKEKLETHLLVHNREYRFLCGICGTGLKRKEHLERHTLEHQELRPHICPECGKGFKRKEHLTIHFTIHTGTKSQTCSLCDKSFYRKDHLQKHLQTHSKMFLEQNIFPLSDQELEIKQEVLTGDDVTRTTDDSGSEGNGIFESNDSATESISNQLELSHIKAASEDRPYICLVCNKTYKRRDHLKMHSLTHVKKDKVCSECGKAFHKEEQLLTHMDSHLKLYTKDAEDLSQLQALLSDQSDLFSSDHGLLIPRPMNVKAENRAHECPICHRKFKRKQHLKVHSNVHLKQATESNIWCSICNEGFRTNQQFENHPCMTSQDNSEGCEMRLDGELEQVHNAPQEAKKENKYPLEFVEADLGNSGEVQLTMVRDERSLPSPQRVYVCKYCSKPFKRKDHYRIHLHIHTGIKSFFCPHCAKGFYRKDHLQKHLQVHTKAKAKPKKSLPDLYPINMLPKIEVKPEITIHAPLNSKLRVPLQIKVPYQMVTALDNGEQHAVTIDPTVHQILS